MVWHEVAEERVVKVATGEAYTDGSSKGGHWRITRAGWAFVVVDSEGRWRWTAKGTVAGLDCSSFRAELQALLEVLRVTVPPLTIYVDNQAVVDGVNKGEEWCTRSGASCAVLWKKVWAILKDLEGQEVVVQKVKAHTTWIQVLARMITYKNHIGNGWADQAAKEAQSVAEQMSPTQGVRAQMGRCALAKVGRKIYGRVDQGH